MRHLLGLLQYSLKIRLSKTWRTAMAVARNTSKVNGTVGRVLPDVSNQIDTATKSTPRSASDRSGLGNDILAKEVLQCAEPYLNALDDKPLILMDVVAKSGREEGEAGDTGTGLPSMDEKQFKSWLMMNLAYLHRQLNGPIIIQDKDARTGRVKGEREIPSLRERLDQSEKTVFGDSFNMENERDPVKYMAGVRALYWLPVNEASVNMFQNLFNSLHSVYKEVYREDWKPLDVRPKQTQADIKNAIAADPKMAELLRRREQMMQERKSA